MTNIFHKLKLPYPIILYWLWGPGTGTSRKSTLIRSAVFNC